MAKFDLKDFGLYVFDDKKMKEYLPYPIYQKWKSTVNKASVLDFNTADAISHAMKTWALNLGATHFCHWFHPLTESTAEKHEAFLEPNSLNEPIMRFSGKALIKGEPDASSFPSGGLRQTFEARGYTYWDCSSYAFIRDNVLCIPSIFISFRGETLDKKAPLLRSIEAVSKASLNILQVLGKKDVTSVKPLVGIEQEYFLIDKKLFLERPDLINADRTLFGNLPAKTQEENEHYFGSIPPRVKKFMAEVNELLWKLAIYAKIEHNETAPCQFEIVPIHTDCNLAIDQNLIIMDVLKVVADKNNLACLLHEKPFSGVNGSGKHNNYSLVTDTGINCFLPKEDNSDEIVFLAFTTALIKAVDTYPELLRMGASGPGNDHRLGGNEAPPAIISLFLGDKLEQVFLNGENHNSIEARANKNIHLCNFEKAPNDDLDRNRTSPIAFTGNKFEFRMVGASLSGAVINTIINTILAEALEEIANDLKAKNINTEKALKDFLCKIVQKHKRILFSKDSYSKKWQTEASELGLPHLRTYHDSLKYFIDEKSVKLFEKYLIYTKPEMHARYEVLVEKLVQVKMIEARTLMSLVNKRLLPSLFKELGEYARTFNEMKNTELCSIKALGKRLTLINRLSESLSEGIANLEELINYIQRLDTFEKKAKYLNDNLNDVFVELAIIINNIEAVMSENNYPFPTYDKLFSSLY